MEKEAISIDKSLELLLYASYFNSIHTLNIRDLVNKLIILSQKEQYKDLVSGFLEPTENGIGLYRAFALLQDKINIDHNSKEINFNGSLEKQTKLWETQSKETRILFLSMMNEYRTIGNEEIHTHQKEKVSNHHN